MDYGWQESMLAEGNFLNILWDSCSVPVVMQYLLHITDNCISTQAWSELGLCMLARVENEERTCLVNAAASEPGSVMMYDGTSLRHARLP